MDKLISIIVPNYNKSNFISEMIESVLSQSFHNWELLFIDDNSTDKSIAIVEEFVQNDQRIKLLNNNSGIKGASACRNIGIIKAKGEFIIFLDSDDLLLKSCLENRVREITTLYELDFIIFSMGTFYYEIGDSKNIWTPPYSNHLNKFLMHDIPWSIVQPIWKKEFLEKINGFDEVYSRLQDVEMHTRALLEHNVKYKISESKTPDCFYRISEERKIMNPIMFYTHWVDSIEIYIEKTFRNIELVKFIKDSSLLKGTLINGLTTLLYAEQKGDINEDDSNRLISRLLKLSLYRFENEKYLKMYIKLYRMGFHNIKGFNFVLRNLYIRFI